ncbi:MAG: FAD-dependent oxidoreductase [Planctomycetota bacterium]|nr:FAD-dependent oxidoreductase [Planctomycetota bacterium]
MLIILAVVQLGFAATVLVEAESFSQRSGWVIDQQSMDVMGSPYLLAHGLGRPVADATTTVTIPEAGEYRIWVRTKDWVARWSAPGAPGKFQLLIDGEPLKTEFGTEGADWHWQSGGTIRIRKRSVTLALRDLTGFDGRCDAILLSTDHQLTPPNKNPKLEVFRGTLLGYPKTPPEAGQYDLVVVGGGMAGCCTAVSAARRGCRVALIQNRPVLGGNNSSEVRVGLSGLIHQQPYPRLGNLVDEIGPVGFWNLWEARRDPDSPRSKRILAVIKKHPEKKIHNAGPATNYEDQKKIDAVRAEKNIRLFLNMHVNGIEMDGSRIAAVVAQNIQTGERLKFKARLFADCTGDGNLGFLAKADFRVGREPRSQTGEKLAPKQGDKLVMGTSVQWYSVEEDQPSTFPDCPWALHFDDTNCMKCVRGDWDWETGANRDQVAEIERIRDHALRATFGNWAVLKNHDRFKKKFANRRLAWVAYIGGKRESRRLLGDVILRQQDIENRKQFPDACVTTTWTIDLHYPKKTPGIEGDAFRSMAKHVKIKPYPIPYRCLYSRNVENLMMAGRNISVTHVALGTVRVQRTTGMMGEALGRAAGLCKKHDCDPRDIYKQHLAEFKDLLKRSIKVKTKESN